MAQLELPIWSQKKRAGVTGSVGRQHPSSLFLQEVARLAILLTDNIYATSAATGDMWLSRGYQNDTKTGWCRPLFCIGETMVNMIVNGS